jgi:hypothetical protein
MKFVYELSTEICFNMKVGFALFSFSWRKSANISLSRIKRSPNESLISLLELYLTNEISQPVSTPLTPTWRLWESATSPRYCTQTKGSAVPRAMNMRWHRMRARMASGVCGVRCATDSRRRNAKTKKLNSMVWVRERTIPTERPPLVGEVIANLCG